MVRRVRIAQCVFFVILRDTISADGICLDWTEFSNILRSAVFQLIVRRQMNRIVNAA